MSIRSKGKPRVRRFPPLRNFFLRLGLAREQTARSKRDFASQETRRIDRETNAPLPDIGGQGRLIENDLFDPLAPYSFRAFPQPNDKAVSIDPHIRRRVFKEPQKQQKTKKKRNASLQEEGYIVRFLLKIEIDGKRKKKKGKQKKITFGGIKVRGNPLHPRPTPYSRSATDRKRDAPSPRAPARRKTSSPEKRAFHSGRV